MEKSRNVNYPGMFDLLKGIVMIGIILTHINEIIPAGAQYGGELSFLKKAEQEMLLTTMDYEQATPSLSQAQRMKKMSQDGTLNEDTMLEVMSEVKKGELDKVSFSSDTMRKYFPKSYTPQRMQETIIKLLEQWQRKRQQQHQR